MNRDPIHVAIGIAAESGEAPMSFYIYDEGVKIHDCHTTNDLTAAIAVLRDLADALELKQRMLTN